MKRIVLSVCAAVAAVIVARAETYTWTGGSGDWATLESWQVGEAQGSATRLPGLDDDVVIPSGDTDYTVYTTVSIAVKSLGIGAIDGTAAGKATFESHTLATNRVSGSLHVYKNGRMTHAAHEKKVNTPKYKLNFEVGADMTIDASGEVNVDTKGYYSMCGQGQSASGVWYAGCPSGSTSTALIYGSIGEPTDLGSGGHSNGYGESTKSGGGAVYLDVAGTLTVNGVVTACGNSTFNGNGGCGGAGGSILLACGTLAGGGIVRADHATADIYDKYSPSYSGGGGRVSLIQREAKDWSAFTGKVWARGGKNSTCGSAGTVYRLCAGSPYGEVRVDNVYDSTDRSNGSYATLPSTNPDTKEVTRGFALTIGGGGKVKITQNWTIYDLSFFNNKATLALGTNTLTLISREHKDGKGWPSGITITSNQTPNGVWGKIVWKKPGFALIVR